MEGLDSGSLLSNLWVKGEAIEFLQCSSFFRFDLL